MANKEQPALLKAGVVGWNKWRKDNQQTTMDLSGANLSEALLRQSPMTADSIKFAQFVYLILNNNEIRDLINTLTSFLQFFCGGNCCI